jgi:hypothetical protein
MEEEARHVLGGLDLLLKKADAVYPAADVDWWTSTERTKPCRCAIRPIPAAA